MARGASAERSERQRLDRQDSLRAKQKTLKRLSENRGPLLLALILLPAVLPGEPKRP